MAKRKAKIHKIMETSDESRDIKLAVIDEKLTTVQRDIESIKQSMDGHSEKYVTVDQFTPVRIIVYGMVSVILLAVIGALVAIVVRGGGLP